MRNLARLELLRLAQRRLEQFYGLESAPDITAFVVEATGEERETLYVRQNDEDVQIAVLLPRDDDDGHTADVLLQVIEGVSHFLFLAERARTNLPATRLELELQGEVDKFVMLALEEVGLDSQRGRELHAGLYERVSFLHPEGTELGDRYRLANGLAARVVARLLQFDHPTTARDELRRFYRAGLADKIRLASAA